MAGSSVPFGEFNWRYDDANHTNADFGVDAGCTTIAPTATSDGSSFSLEVLSPTTGRFTFDDVSLDITFGRSVDGDPVSAGPPASLFFTLFDNNGEADDMGRPTGEHVFYFDNLKIERPSAAIPGDHDGNGVVDAGDYVVWRKSDGSQMGYDLWRANFGRTAGSGAVAGAQTAVPEPMTVLLTFIAAIAAAMMRQRPIRLSEQIQQ